MTATAITTRAQAQACISGLEGRLLEAEQRLQAVEGRAASYVQELESELNGAKQRLCLVEKEAASKQERLDRAKEKLSEIAKDNLRLLAALAESQEDMGRLKAQVREIQKL